MCSSQFNTGDFEKVKIALFILAEAIESGRIQGICHDVTEALYPDSDVVDHSELDQDKKQKKYCNGEPCTCYPLEQNK